MMRSKKFEGWQSIVENVIWDLSEGRDRILAVLKLSFDELGSPPLKQCFAYCSMFIIDFEFGKDDLRMASPFPNQYDLEMEDTGNEYFNILLQNTFFSRCVRMDVFGNITKCKMHDLVHDLAIYVSKSKNLRSLFFNGAVLGMNSPEVKALRVLNLYKTNIHELPDSTGKLKHLRYLNVMETKIKAFPKSLGQLYNLQTLKMPYDIGEFPKQIANLIILRRNYFGKYVKVPAVVLGRLTNLRSLPFLKVGKETGPRIEELNGLNHLRNTLFIFNLEHVRDGEEAVKANLVEKKHVRRLVLRWTPNRPNNSAEVVLEVLRPHSNLEYLEIHDFMGIKFPSWLLRSDNLKEIEFQGCTKCERVPVPGHLPNLVRVKMNKMPKLRFLGYEFYGYGHISDDIKVLFPALKTLHIKYVEWMEIPAERGTVCPCLEELTLTGCEQLRRSPSHFPSLKRYMECGETEKVVRNQPESFIFGDKQFSGLNLYCSFPNPLLRISSRLTSLPSGLAMASPQVFTRLKSLSIGPFWKELDSFPAFQVLPQLESLEIYGWPKLKSLPEQTRSFLMYLPSVQAMHRLTKLDRLNIRLSPLLSERCSEESGPEWPKISHIPDKAGNSFSFLFLL
ncbi:hypothetical protein ACLB2K_060493 [Fragaria x ananassa]